MRDRVRVHGSGCDDNGSLYTGQQSIRSSYTGQQSIRSLYSVQQSRHAIRTRGSGCGVHGSRMQVTRRAGQRDAHRAPTSAVLSFENVGVPGVLIKIPK